MDSTLKAHLTRVDLPDFGMPQAMPELPPALYATRLQRLDEWVNSPVAPGSAVELRSGMTLQVDINPATGTEYFTTNIEDGIALADESLRRAFTTAYQA